MLHEQKYPYLNITTKTKNTSESKNPLVFFVLENTTSNPYHPLPHVGDVAFLALVHRR